MLWCSVVVCFGCVPTGIKLIWNSDSPRWPVSLYCLQMTSYSPSPFWRSFCRLTGVSWLPECLHSGFIGAKNDRSCGDIWALICAELQSNCHHQKNRHPTFNRLDALPVTQPPVSKHLWLHVIDTLYSCTSIGWGWSTMHWWPLCVCLSVWKGIVSWNLTGRKLMKLVNRYPI